MVEKRFENEKASLDKTFFFKNQFKLSKLCCSLVMEDTDNLHRVVVITDAV